MHKPVDHEGKSVMVDWALGPRRKFKYCSFNAFTVYLPDILSKRRSLPAKRVRRECTVQFYKTRSETEGRKKKVN